MKGSYPVVAVIGRPNVGKSSLFNQIVGFNQAIVDSLEGVTRDINHALIDRLGINFYLMDTAGYLESGEDVFNQKVQEKIRTALDEADLVLFMVDGRNLHPVDEEMALLLRKQKKPVVVLANKLDNLQMEDFAVEFEQFGFSKVIPYSVTQKRGKTVLLETIEDFLKENFKNKKHAQDDEIRIAVIGKPNVGKSTLINSILGYNRSLVSDIPGTTRDALSDMVTYHKKNIRIIDTAGLKKKSKVKGDLDYYSQVRTIKAVEQAHVVILLIESKDLKVSHQDRYFVEMVQEKGRGLIVAVNKWDLVFQSSDENYRLMRDTEKAVYEQIPAFRHIPVQFISAKNQYKLEKLMDTVLQVHKDFHYRISTHELNEWLSREIRESNTVRPVSNLKVYYATQIYEAPPAFLIFVNQRRYLTKNFPRYFENRLRLSFEFRGVPIKLIFKEKNKDKEERERNKAIQNEV